ncbi:MAG TPA: hypothetical protein VMS76_19530 [Planctomycetota bacterium]|nr:hypothetical protein [Planctomycetota bacterium]
MSPAGAGWPRWLLVALLVLAVVVLIPLGWMACAMFFGGGLMGGTMGPGMMGGGMMGSQWAWLLGTALLLVLLVALILLVVRELSRRNAEESARSQSPEPPGGASGPRRPE